MLKTQKFHPHDNRTSCLTSDDYPAPHLVQKHSSCRLNHTDMFLLVPEADLPTEKRMHTAAGLCDVYVELAETGIAQPDVLNRSYSLAACFLQLKAKRKPSV